MQSSWQAQRFVNLDVQIWQAQRFVNFNLQISWQAQHFVYLHLQMSWQAQHFANLDAQIAWQAQYFVNLHAQISWQAQHLVNLHASPIRTSTGKLRGTTVAGRSRAMVGHARNRPSIVVRVFTCFLKCRFRGRHGTL